MPTYQVYFADSPTQSPPADHELETVAANNPLHAVTKAILQKHAKGDFALPQYACILRQRVELGRHSLVYVSAIRMADYLSGLGNVDRLPPKR